MMRRGQIPQLEGSGLGYSKELTAAIVLHAFFSAARRRTSPAGGATILGTSDDVVPVILVEFAVRPLLPCSLLLALPKPLC